MNAIVSSNTFWIGHYRSECSGANAACFTWDNPYNHQPSFSHWSSGEPNDAGGPYRESCTHMYHSGYWNDIPCTHSYPYVCSVPSTLCSGLVALGAASGEITDGSAPNQEYVPNMECTWVIDPPGNDGVKLNFLSFNLESSHDTVQIYNGAVYNGQYSGVPQLGTVSGAPTSFTEYRSTGPMTVLFTTDHSIQYDGFSAFYDSYVWFNCASCDTYAACDVIAETCTCNPGFYGGGFAGDCQDINECLNPSTCHEQATCQNLVIGPGQPLTHSCTCNVYHTGDGVNCEDVDECAVPSDNCHDDATCINKDVAVDGVAFDCACNNGYHGDGVTCTDNDECTDPLYSNNCHEKADCFNDPGTFHCTCQTGYNGAGTTCTDINECGVSSDNSCDDTHGVCNNNDGSFTCSCRPGYTIAQSGDPLGDGSDGTICFDEDECSFGTHNCDVDATCTNTDGGFTCACNFFFVGDGFDCRAMCTEQQSEDLQCHMLAYCEDNGCICPEGIYGAGNGENGCTKEAFTVHFTISLGQNFNMADANAQGKLLSWETDKAAYIALFPTPLPPGFATSLHHEVTQVGSETFLSLNALYPDLGSANIARAALEAAVVVSSARRSAPTVFGVDLGSDGAFTTEPRTYRWVGQTTSAEHQIAPTGLTVDSVFFKSDCENSGCWVVDVTYTLGKDNFNVLYIPHSVGNDALSFDFNYDVQMDSSYTMTAEETFEPSNFPCGSNDYVPSSGGVPDKVTGCCLPAFMDLYRPVSSFITDLSASVRATCANAGQHPLYLPGSEYVTDPGVTYAGKPVDAVIGSFKGMQNSYSTFTGVNDPYIRQYTARIFLDEVELRQNAGMLSGTVGVEHTVDTFIGLANFKPTGIPFLDPFNTQTNIHLEKTSFFSVSTHGTNDYTFLQYVNLRLVAVYQQDNDFSGLDEASLETVRTDKTAAAHYVQVTFTVGAQYGVNDPNGAGLIPLDSVRAGQGDFMDSSTLVHKCLDYQDSTGVFAAGAKATFDARFDTAAPNLQDCAPAAQMCSSPTTIPDQFVSFNIPLGIDWFPIASSTLDANVFVDLVVNAEDTLASGTAANSGGAARQMKTTLTASIPVVEGGVNIFCDGVTSKTDLKDVANVDLIIGSASDLDEASRLTIFTDIASTNLDQVDSPAIDTDSIESGLMTLVVKGNTTYFTQSTATSGYSLVLEDVITVHIMEEATCGAEVVAPFSCVFNEVKAMVAEAMDENDGDVDGYNLNGAFKFRIDRLRQRAYLEPTDTLTGICPFSPAPPASNSVPLETCVVRRDVRYRGFPHKNGGWSTAMEIALPGASLDEEARFMQTVLGKSEYADQLGRNYTTTIAARYAALGHTLNGRYNRAYWINPGYEWTPTQTGGESIFTLSQKILLFALVNLDEGFVYPTVCEMMDGSDSDGDGLCTFAPSDDQLVFGAASLACQAQGGELASIHSVAQQAEAWNVVVNKAWQNEQVFIGGYEDSNVNMQKTTGWLWKDGSAVDYNNFHSGQPDVNQQDCIVFWGTHNGLWDNQGCNEQKHFICQASVTEPAVGADLHLPAARRRMLLSNVDSGASMAASSVSFSTSPKSMMASAFGVPEHLVATFKVEFQLTAAEACMSPTMLQAALRDTLDDYLLTTASSFETVQVTGMQVDRGSEECEDPNAVRRSKSIRKLLSSFSSATAEVDMLVVFSPGTTATINLPDLAKMSGIEAVDAVDVPDQIEVSEEYVNPNPGKKETIVDPESSGGSESGGSSMGLIAGVCGGVGAVLLLALIALLYKRSKPEPRPAEIVNAVSVEDLKHQLQEEV